MGISSSTGLALGLLFTSVQLSLLGFSIIHSLPFNFLCLYHLRSERTRLLFSFSLPQKCHWTEVLFLSSYQDMMRGQSWSPLHTRPTRDHKTHTVSVYVAIVLCFSVCYSSAPPWDRSLLLLQRCLPLLSPRTAASYPFPSLCFVLSTLFLLWSLVILVVSTVPVFPLKTLILGSNYFSPPPLDRKSVV